MLKMIVAKLLKNKNFILSAGMLRSGSTLLYNILRICLVIKYGKNFNAGWIDNITNYKTYDNYLMKTHSLDRKLTFCANHVFYSYRDVRACLASQTIKFTTKIDIEFCRAQIQQYQFAKKSGAVMVSYEALMQDKEKLITEIAEIFKITLPPAQIIEQLPPLQMSRQPSSYYDRETLLHNDHGTGLARSEWSDVLGNDLLQQIESEFKWWFDETGYQI